MSIPLYFATRQKENVTQAGATAIPYSCGSSKNGSLRVPEHFWQGTPLLIDDAVTVPFSPQSLKKLMELCTHGCILDFERSVSSFHIGLIRKLSEVKLPLFWISERFSEHAPEAIPVISHSLPHNSWQQYCKSLQNKYKKGWALELQPVQCSKKLSYPQTVQEFYLSAALCRAKVKNNMITYYDTRQTLIKKLQIAKDFGCHGAIALWSEWPKK